MKTKNLIIFLTLFAFIFSANSQENKVIKEETTVKKVITKEGSKVVVKEVKEVDKETGAVMVADDENENQEFNEAIKKDKAEEVVTDQEIIDVNNEKLIAAQKKKQEDELKASIEAEKAKAAEEKKILEEQKQARQKALEENRKKLEKRSKGMAPLKKKKDN